jgi:hypothetical protein
VFAYKESLYARYMYYFSLTSDAQWAVRRAAKNFHATLKSKVSAL